MDTSAEFTSLVAAHHRLMAKYGRGGRWNANTSSHRVSNVQEGFTGESAIADGAPWIQPSLTTQRPVTHRAMDVLETTCCPRCHLRIGTKPFEVMSLPESYAGSDCGDKMLSPGLGTTGASGSIYLQLASMEYARLLAALNVGNRTLATLIPDTLAAVQSYTTTYTEGYTGRTSLSQTKRKPQENAADAQQTIAVKRTRLVWTDELHQRFVEAIERIGIDKAVPKAILEMMGVDGLTRENVASHLQKYRKKIRQASASKERARFPESEERTVERSATTHGSNDFAEIDSTASATNNTGYSVTTAMPDQK